MEIPTIREKIVSRLFWIRKRIRVNFYFLFARAKSIYWGVKLGNRCKFDGPMQFYKFPGSSILIGNDCRFNSLTIATQAGISRPCSIWTISSEAIISIENGCGFSGVAISCHKSIIIKANVRIGSNVTIMDSDQHLDDPRVGLPSSITIHENVWIGSNCIVLKGVSIGKNSIIAAGSLVNKDISENTIAAGIPAKKIQKIKYYEKDEFF